jgi:hypothetical protein
MTFAWCINPMSWDLCSKFNLFLRVPSSFFGHKVTCGGNPLWCIIRIARCYWCITLYGLNFICQHGYGFSKHLHETHYLTQNVKLAPCYKFHECAKFNQDNSFSGHCHACTHICASHTSNTVNNSKLCEMQTVYKALFSQNNHAHIAVISLISTFISWHNEVVNGCHPRTWHKVFSIWCCLWNKCCISPAHHV